MLQIALWWIGALIVALVAIVTIRKMNYDDGPHWAVTLLVLVVAGNVAWFGERYVRHRHAERVTEQVMANMSKDPMFAAIREADPATYGRLRKVVEDTEGFPDDVRAERSRDLSMPIITAFIEPKISHPSDEIIVRSARFGMEMVRRRIASTGKCDLLELRFADAERWKKWRDDLSPDESTMTKDFLMAVIRSEPDMSPTAYDPGQVKMMIASRMPAVLARGGIQVETLAQTRGDDDMKCRVGLLMLEDILSMPQDQAAPTLRSFARITMS